MTVLICERCSKPTEKRGHYQKYCVECSEARSEERKRTWNKAHPPKLTDELRVQRVRDKDLRKERGVLRSAAQSTSLVNSLPVNGYPDDQIPSWYFRIMVPYLGAVSKNYIWGFSGKGGHVYKRQQSNDYRATISLLIKSSLRENKFKVYNNKVWLDFFVQKPTHKSDAINVVDLLCDALKDGLGVDDRWFCIRRLDWEIVKGDPQIYIGISQGPQFDAQACSYCGAIKSLEEFNLQAHNKNGRHRVCKTCSSLKSKIKAEAA